MMPERPSELDKLDVFVGSWTFESTANFAGLDEPIHANGESKYQWSDDKGFLMGHGMFRMEELDAESQGLETWIYDTKAKKYRVTYTDSMGATGGGTATYDEKTGAWKMNATSHSPWGQTWLKGTIMFHDDDTMEWSMTEHGGFLGLMKMAEFSGVGHRQ
jgi:hypothetical protein